MIPREILNKIRQIEIRTHRLVTGFAGDSLVVANSARADSSFIIQHSSFPPA
jgi:hypothetical protein